MKRLGYELPSFFQMQWRSSPIQTLWESRIKRINNAWRQIELSRDSSITNVSSDDIGNFILSAHARGKLAYPIAKVGVGSFYNSREVEAKKGESFEFRVVTCPPEKVDEWRAAWGLDDEKIGELLGYPPCCTSFFKDVWVKQRYVDTSWLMAVNSVPSADFNGVLGKFLHIQFPSFSWKNNLLLRWLGVRPVSHLPCSFDCIPTGKLTDYNIEKGTELGFAEEMGWMIELLSIPLKWTAKHGIGEVTTELFRFCFNTDVTADEYKIELNSDKKISVPSSIPDDWTDNGFSSYEAQEEAHKRLVEFILPHISNDGAVLDLGCGNGKLLFEINRRKEIHPYGVDLSERKIVKARKLNATGEFWADSIFNNRYWVRFFDVILLAPQRLNEVPDHSDFIRALSSSTNRVIFYMYGGDPSKFIHFLPHWTVVASSKEVVVLDRVHT